MKKHKEILSLPLRCTNRHSPREQIAKSQSGIVFTRCDFLFDTEVHLIYIFCEVALNMERERFTLGPIPTRDEYNLRDTLEAAQEELVKLMQERQLVEWRINKLQSDIIHLAALCHVEVEDPIKQLGLTDAVRYIFGREGRPLSIDQIVDVLDKSYDDVAAYKNLPANVHTIVRRLVKAGEVKLSTELPMHPPAMQVGDDKDKYVWCGGMPFPPPRQFNARGPRRVSQAPKPPSSLTG